MEAVEVEGGGGWARLRKGSAAAIQSVTAWVAASMDSWVGAAAVPAGAIVGVDGRACCGSLRKNVTESDQVRSEKGRDAEVGDVGCASGGYLCAGDGAATLVHEPVGGEVREVEEGCSDRGVNSASFLHWVA